MNLFIVLAWFVSYKTGASIDLQLYIVVGLGILFTFVSYGYAKRMLERGSKALNTFKKVAKALHIEKKGIWYTIQRIIDKL